MRRDQQFRGVQEPSFDLDAESTPSPPAVGHATLTGQRKRKVTPAQGVLDGALMDGAWAVGPVQLHRDAHTALDDRQLRATAAHGVSGRGDTLPHLDAIQRSFGHHDVTGVRAHVGGAAGDASRAIGAHAYATGDQVAFAESPSLFLAAHEAAHVVQQRAGVQLSSAVGADGDAYEREADAVAERVVRGESAADLLGGASASTAGGDVVQRKAGLYPRPTEPGLIYRVPEQTLINPVAWTPKPTTLMDHHLSIAKGAVDIFGLPLDYDVFGDLTSTRGMSAHLDRGRLYDIELYTTHADDMPDRRDPVLELAELIVWERRMESRRLGGRAKASAGAHFEASVKAEASAGVKVGFAHALDASVTGGVTGQARVRADTTLKADALDLYYQDGAMHLVEADLAGALQLGWELDLYPWIELALSLHLPEIPIVTKAISEISGWPVIGWFLPDPKKVEWKKTWRKEWAPVLSKRGQMLSMLYQMSAFGRVPDPTLRSETELQYQAMADAAKAVLEGKPDKDIPKVATDAGHDRDAVHGADPGAVANTRETARARIASARTAIARERAWDRRALARVSRALDAARQKAAQAGGPALASVPTISPGHVVPDGDTGAAADLAEKKRVIDARESQLGKDEQNTDTLTQRVHDVEAQVEHVDDGPTRNQANRAYETVAGNAAALGDEINGAGKTNVYRRPQVIGADAADAPATDAALEAEVEARRRDCFTALKAAEDQIRTELNWSEAIASQVASNIELHRYALQLQEHERVAVSLLNHLKNVAAQADSLEQTVPQLALQARGYQHLTEQARALGVEVARAIRPAPPWDTRFVHLVGSTLRLLPESGADIRATFFGKNYREATMAWRQRQIHVMVVPSTQRRFWYYADMKSPRNDSWWIDDGNELGPEYPTIDHFAESVSRFWGRRGRLTDQATRIWFYNGWGVPDRNLMVKPRKANSSGPQEPRYTDEVGVNFRGPRGGEE